MCPNVLWKNVKLQSLHANSSQPVTTILSGDFHRDNISLTSHFVQSYFNDCHHLCMFSHVSYSAFLAGHDTWTEDLSAKENPFFLLQQCCCCCGTARGGETQLLQEICGTRLCWFSPTARDQWGARAKERWPSLAWSFTSILLPFQPACPFHSIVKFKCHGIDLSGNKFSQRQSLKKP